MMSSTMKNVLRIKEEYLINYKMEYRNYKII